MLRFKPILQPAPWGGENLAGVLGRVIAPGEIIGESWELVDLPVRGNRCETGALAGKSLGELWREGALGGTATGAFPFLLKWIDAAQNLSVQVHPDQLACQKLGLGAPKTEAWYVAKAEPQAVLWMGHYPGLDTKTLQVAIQNGTLPKWLYQVTPRVGEMYLIPAGTIHAIGSGLLLLEVQEPSETTFRLYDWGRVDAQGQSRQLHLPEAAVSVHYKRHGAPAAVKGGVVVGPCFAMGCLTAGQSLPAAGLRVLVAAQGCATLQSAQGIFQLQMGDVVVGEPTEGEIVLTQGRVVLVTEPHMAATFFSIE